MDEPTRVPGPAEREPEHKEEGTTARQAAAPDNTAQATPPPTGQAATPGAKKPRGKKQRKKQAAAQRAQQKKAEDAQTPPSEEGQAQSPAQEAADATLPEGAVPVPGEGEAAGKTEVTSPGTEEAPKDELSPGETPQTADETEAPPTPGEEASGSAQPPAAEQNDQVEPESEPGSGDGKELPEASRKKVNDGSGEPDSQPAGEEPVGAALAGGEETVAEAGAQLAGDEGERPDDQASEQAGEAEPSQEPPAEPPQKPEATQPEPTKEQAADTAKTIIMAPAAQAEPAGTGPNQEEEEVGEHHVNEPDNELETKILVVNNPDPSNGAHEAPVQAPVPPQDGRSQRPKKRKKKKKVRTRTVIWRAILNVFKMVFVFVCIGLVAVSVVAVGVVNYVVGATENDDTLLDLENIKLSQTSYIYAYDEDLGEWVEYQELISASEHRIWANLSQIPDDLKNAIIATEDREFENHHGVSFTRTAYAVLNEFFELQDRTFGASTIDQQVVKNLTQDKAVTDDDGDRSAGYLRKLREIFRAWGLNNRYSKDMILEVYLNTIGLSEKLVGVQAGAQTYFNKDVTELNLWECATIAGITQAPTYYSPIQNPENALKRRNDVLFFMYECDYISEAEFNNAVRQPLGLDLTEMEESGGSVFTYFSDTVFYEVVGDLMTEYGYDYSEAVNYIYTGGLRIYSTVDLNLQSIYEDLYEHGYDEDGYFTNLTNGAGGRKYKDVLTINVDEKDEEGNVVGSYEMLPQSAIASVRYDGSLAAVVGGIGEKDTSLSLNRATQSPRQVGSTIKPISVYALGIDLGIINWSSMRMDAPSQFKDGSATGGMNEDGSYNYNWPQNATLRYRRSNVPVVTAVAESINTIAVRVGNDVTVEEMFNFLRDTLQISTLVAPGEMVDADGNVIGVSDKAIASMALGALTTGITAYELAGAYSIFGGEDQYGVYNSLHSYYYVEDTKGSIVLKPNVAQVQAVSEETGYIMNRLLANVLGGSSLPANGSPTANGKKPEGDMDAVAKTGTTNDDTDRWLVGMTPYYVTAIWWGYDSNSEVGSGQGITRWNRGSYNMASNLWKHLMEEAQADLEYKEFPARPDSVIQQTYCAYTGLLATESCSSRYVGWYAEGDQLLEACQGHAGLLGVEVPEE